MTSLRLVSLWEMLRNYAHAFVRLSNRLSVLEEMCRFESESIAGVVFEPELSEEANKLLDDIASECRALDFEAIQPQIDRMRHTTKPECDAKHAVAGLRDLRERIQDTLLSRQFLYVAPGVATYFDAPLVEWDDVPDKFPSAMHDIEEAGKCLALERHTACVFHLMRVLEVGLKAQAKELGAVVPREEWGHYIDHIEAKIRGISSANPKPSDWRETEHFHSEASAHFRALKNAWRNATMHGRGTYGGEQARTIYENARGFMRHIASKLAE